MSKLDIGKKNKKFKTNILAYMFFKNKKKIKTKQNPGLRLAGQLLQSTYRPCCKMSIKSFFKCIEWSGRHNFGWQRVPEQRKSIRDERHPSRMSGRILDMKGSWIHLGFDAVAMASSSCCRTLRERARELSDTRDDIMPSLTILKC